ncbi:hypothetical protein MIND_00769800 [Mycena indigotica]|uniref:Uncharacterized protein n=1 Tax=Mycena indigotica TaxID=2126181 RepID=A0A8H6W7F0_9AGAR|nr:uncharacterized protein MIND_00769800 [Mycena indigotica]KAF7302034.1 hypothetical protein MIND_00769800 [Mycena indigotica]
MLSNTTISRPRPPAQVRRSSRTLPQGASPPPPYASSLHHKEGESSLHNYLGSPLSATLQMVGRTQSQPSSPQQDDWLHEKSREELAELLHKADDLIRERETELGATSAVCKSLYESNVSLKTKHDALIARFPSSSPNESPDQAYDSLVDDSDDTNHDTQQESPSPHGYFRRSRRISIHPSDISQLADQNAELLQKLQTLEEEAQVTDRQGRRALKQLEKELSLLRDELEKTQARSEQLEKQAQVGPEKIVEELWRKKKEREAKFRAMRNNNTPARAPWPFDDSEVRDFAPPGPFSKDGLSPSKSTDFDASYGPEHSFEHPNQAAVVSQLLAKIKELEETNTRIIQQQTETADKLQAVQRETETISKVYECFSPEHGIQWEVVTEDGRKSPIDGTIRFRSFRRSLESSQSSSHHDDSSLMLPRQGPRRKSVLDLFDDGTAPGFGRPSTPHPDTLSSIAELSPLHFNSPGSEPVRPRQTLQAELGGEFMGVPLSRQGSIYDLSFDISPSPSPGPGTRPLPDDFSMRAQSTPAINALRLSVEPPTPPVDLNALSTGGSLREKNKQRHERMSQTLFMRTGRWQDGRFSSISSASSLVDESTPRRDVVSLPKRLSSAFDVVMENFGVSGPDEEERQVVAAPSQHKAESSIVSVVFDEGGQRKRAFVAFILEAWLWLQFAVVIVVFLWAMAKRGPKSVLGEADRRAVVKRAN